MTCATLSLPAARSATSPRLWSGRILSGAIGGFLMLDGFSRVILARALVAPSEAAPTLEPSLQVPLGAALLLGLALQLARPTRLIGGGLVLLCVGAVIAVEAAAGARSPTHMLFWIYVGALMLAGLALRLFPSLR